MEGQGQYEAMIRQNGSIAGEGIRGLAQVAAQAGNEMNLEQGHGELVENFRLPLHPGHYANRDDLRKAKYIGGEYATNRGGY